ncbi:MAG TPA: hypothetical protein VML75_15340 [Kofleriaceae bacterium]|nr:hypothetical protein [Kofleriaceae bacterium]
MPMIIDDAIGGSGETIQTRLSVEGSSLLLEVTGRASVALPGHTATAVLRRYGRPLEHPPAILERLELPDGAWLGRMRFHAVVDAEGRDYLVLGDATREPVAAIATTVAAALRFLAERAVK